MTTKIHPAALLMSVIGVVITMAGTALASETEYIFHWAPGDTSFHITDADAGAAADIEIRFDTATQKLSFEMTLEPPTVNPSDWLARAFTLVLSPGPYPFPGGGEYAVFYFDATDINNPRLSVYPYSANECCQDSLSFITEDKICTSVNPASCPGWIDDIVALNLSNGSRVFRFTIDAAFINNLVLANPNINGVPWKGTGFQELVGVWLTPLGHPDVAFTYGEDGFITDLNVGPPGAHHLGFYDGSNMATVRDPICEGVPSQPTTVAVGQNFSFNFSGSDPDNDALTLTYSGVPAGATMTPESGATQNGLIRGTFSWIPAQSDNNTSHTISITFTDEEGRRAQCPFSVNVPPSVPPQCEDDDITAIKAAIDSTTDQQAHLVRVLTSKYVRAAKGTSLENEAKKFRKLANAKANALYTDSWTIVWTTLPTAITTCSNDEFCVQLSYTSNVASVDRNSAELLALTEDVRAALAGAGRGTKKAGRSARALRAKNKTLIANVPTVTTVCQ